MNVRMWNVDDNDALVRWCEADEGLIENMGFPEGSGIADVQMKMMQSLMDQNTAMIAVESDDAVAAMVTLVRVSDHSMPLVHIVVNPERRGKAVWYARAVKRFLAEKGIHKMIAMVPSNRGDVRRLAEHLGFYSPDVEMLVCDNGGG